jgi:hypothetical protein
MTQQPEEEWRWVVGYEGMYEVSNLGRVASHVGRGRRSGRHLLKLSPNDKGYLAVTLCRNGHQEKSSVHRLVARAFVNGYAPDREVNHRDLDNRHNAATNLEWVTPDENRLHAYAAKRIGPWAPSPPPRRIHPRAGNVVHSAETVQAIRAIGDAQTSRAVGQMFGISKSQVNRIRSGQNRSRTT